MGNHARLVGQDHPDLGNHQWWPGLDAEWKHSQGGDCLWRDCWCDVANLDGCCNLGIDEIERYIRRDGREGSGSQ